MTRVYLWQRGLEANRPLPGIQNRLYFATDTGNWFIDNGVSWEAANLAPRGAYSAGTTYYKQDLVTSGGSTWRALQSVTGVTPVEGANWTLFAAKGDAGATGAAGSTGPPGPGAYTTTSANFTQPATSSNVTVTVGSTSWIATGQYIYVSGGGYYTVSSITDATHVVLTNLGYTGNAAPAATVSSGAGVSPGGIQGATGATGGVSSVFTRTGAVVAASGDYNAGQITNTAAGQIAATTVQAALNELDSEKAHFADLFSDHVVSGFNPSLPGATLTMTTPAGVAYIGGARVSIAADTSRAYTASRDTYLDVNASGTYTAVAVTNGAAEPAVTASSLRLLKVVTSGTQVTAITQRNQGTAFNKRLATGAFSAYLGTNQTVTASTTTLLNIDTEEFDANSWFDPTASFRRYTPQQAGFYHFSCSARMVSGTASDVIIALLFKNGSSLKQGPTLGGVAGSGMKSMFSCIAYANGSTDYFDIRVFSTITTITSGVDNTFFQGVYLGAAANVPGP